MSELKEIHAAAQQTKRDFIIAGLEKLPVSNVWLFKRLYSPGDVGASITVCVAGIPDDKLDWAFKQVENTLAKQK
jgi:hypothetical protein